MWSRNKKESISLLKPKRHHDIILLFINPTKVVNCETYIYEILYKTIILKFLYQGTISLEKSYPGYDISGEIVPRVRFLQRNRTHSIWVRFLLGTISPGYDFSSNHSLYIESLMDNTSLMNLNVKLNWDANRFLQAEIKDCMNSASYRNMSARRGTQFVPTGMPIIFPAKTTKMLSTRNWSILMMMSSSVYLLFESQCSCTK